LLPLDLVVIIFLRISQFRDAISSVPDTSLVFLLARKPAKLLVILSGLLASMPLCLAAASGFRKEQRETDEVGNLMAQLVVLVGVELSAFFGLVALVRVTAWEIVKRSEPAEGFQVQPHRWIVGRTLGWLNRLRRLSKDYEATTDGSVAMIKLAMIHVMVRRIAPVSALLDKLLRKMRSTRPGPRTDTSRGNRLELP
jgi:Transposase DDE domain